MELSSHVSNVQPAAAAAFPNAEALSLPRARAKPISRVKHIALIGNHLPRRCGIATYTTDIQIALKRRYPAVRVDVWAMNDVVTEAPHDGPMGYAYPDCVTGTIDQDDRSAYLSAARAITASGADMVWIQHEFGIFGGRAGDHILTLIDRITVPIAVAMHTVLAEPDRDQRRVTLALVARCETIIVMAEAARRILIEFYGANPDQVIVIPHGIPDRPFTETGPMKAKLGLTGRDVILTFGLLSPGKGIETMIAAMPSIVRQNPNALYLVLGATHPHCISRSGEAYRESLMALSADLGMAEHVRFIDAFFDVEDVLDHLAAADVYATPYLNPAQVTSGTLAYAVGLGKPVVSTPYVHARELFSNGLGHLVDFGDSDGFAVAINKLFSDPISTMRLRQKTYALGRTMIWPRLAEASLTRFEAVARRQTTHPRPIHPARIPPALGVDAIERLTDSTGMIQHSILGVPDRAHGYCIDDNARAMMLMARRPALLPALTPSLADARCRHLLHVYAAFVEHGWCPETNRFRNFMGFDRQWREDRGSEDSCGRTIWALGITATQAADPEIVHWARALYERTIGPLSELRSPRAMAFMMLGSAALAHADPTDTLLPTLLARWGDGLMALWHEYRKPGWDWFEPVLAYDNARIPEALIRAGTAIGREDFVRRGVKALNWLMAQQTSSAGSFRAVGSDSFARIYAPPLPFDQQPLETWAAVDACDAAFDATGDTQWKRTARTAYLWFLGQNDCGVVVADPQTGECFDGLIPTGVNRNRGAESVLAFHHATATIQRQWGQQC
jgi:glycosyltransferase involved in cell wall biosynthesis